MTTRTSEPIPHEELLRAVVQPPLSEEDALLWMALLHTHRVRLRPKAGGTAANGGAPVLAALTQRGAAEAVAALWPDRADERAGSPYWYFQYNSRTPYETLSQVPRELLPRLLEFRDRLASEPRVLDVEEE